MQETNYWNEFEYSKLRLLLNNEKVNSILGVRNGIKKMDEHFPISVELHLTDNCNLNCEWCTDKELRQNKAVLDAKIIKSLFREFWKHGTGVTLEGGGEPTLHPNFREVVEIGNSFNIDMGLITNGTVDISGCIEKLKWVRVSLDSSSCDEYKREKGIDCYGCVLKNLEKMSKARNPMNTFVGVGYVLTTRNQSNLINLVKRLDIIGVDYIYLRPVEEAGNITPSLESLLDLRKELAELTADTRIKYMLAVSDRVVDKNAGLPCIAHSLTSVIHANGEVALCEKRRTDGIILGNVYDSSFEDIWISPYREQISQKLLNAECQNGCSACRVTGFNMIFEQLEKVHSKRFI
ncbi:MAG: radical SAM protein [Lachnospiraceae bacterium]|nr:radical SAM protein [Lachnospiraceae bacterium]